MQSYIGVLACQKVSITYDSWKQVPNDVKELIWESANYSFIVSPAWKVGCLKSANDKWKQFKSALTKDFVFGRCHDPLLLNIPPNGYGIPQADWSQFVISRMSDDFKKKVSNKVREFNKTNTLIDSIIKDMHGLNRKWVMNYVRMLKLIELFYGRKDDLIEKGNMKEMT